MCLCISVLGSGNGITALLNLKGKEAYLHQLTCHCLSVFPSCSLYTSRKSLVEGKGVGLPIEYYLSNSSVADVLF